MVARTSDKGRTSVLVGANCDGSEILPLLDIVKSRKPRYFECDKRFPTKYKANINAWLTQNTFKKDVHELVERFINEKR